MTRSSLEATSAFYSSQGGALMQFSRWGLRAAQQWWPAMAVRAAARLFGTPLPPRWLNRRRAWGAPWQITRWAFEDASLTLYRHDDPSTPATGGPVALLVHGWGGHAGQMVPLATALQQQGVRTVILEMPAHGRNDGAVSNLPQFARAVDYACARLAQEGTPVETVIAHSLGANAAAYALSRGAPARRLVLLAPPASPLEYTRLFARVFGLTEATRLAMQRRVEAREAVLMPQFEPPSVGPRLNVPTLVVHDRRDSVNPFADGEAFAQHIAGARLIATEGLGHRHILKDARVLGEVTAFVAGAAEA